MKILLFFPYNKNFICNQVVSRSGYMVNEVGSVTSVEKSPVLLTVISSIQGKGPLECRMFSLFYVSILLDSM